MIKQTLNTLKESMLITFTILTVIIVAMAILKILAPMWPAITALFMITVTYYGAEKSWVMSLGGLVLYLASWSVVSTYGSFFGLVVFTIGTSFWLAAPFVTLPEKRIPCFVRAK